MMIDKPHHVLTLVIQKETDIPRIRSKVKLLVRAIDAPVRQVVGLAVGASETARLLLQKYGGGKVRISLFPQKIMNIDCGVELLFHGKTSCLKGRICPVDEQALLVLPPFPGLMTVFDSVQVQGGTGGRKITIICRNIRLGVTWEEVHKRLSSIRGELFADTEESYVENLRAKHDEVVRLLQEKTEKNRLLDQSNNELLQLSNDLEKLARERTIIEMSLRIADQVRNPATVIGGMARRLMEKGNLTGREQKKIQVIASEAEKIEALVKQFNTMAAERRTLFAREDLVLLIEDALQTCPTLQSKNIRVKLYAPPKPVEIHANRQVLKVALVHILRYLTRQLPEGEGLSVDIGKGMEPRLTINCKLDSVEHMGSEKPTAMDSATESDKAKGLELVRQILTEHQAEFTVESNAEGKVAVSIRFPRVFHEQWTTPTGSTE